MDAAKVLGKVRTNKLLRLFLFELAFVVFCFLLCHPHFENNDDFGLLGVVSGFFGECDPHMVFTNVLLGKVLVFLYSLCHSFNWYVAFHVATMFGASLAISYVLLPEEDDRYALFCILMFHAFFTYECYVNMQFTKTAGISSIAGLALIIRNVTKEKISPIGIGFGVLLALIGSMIRFQAFLIALFAAGVFYLVYLCFQKPAFKRILIISVILALTSGLCLGARLYDRAAYTNDDEWGPFMEYNAERAKFTDRPFPVYADNVEFYESLGLSENDVYLFSHWTFDDPDICTLDLMKTIDAEKKTPPVSDMIKTFGAKILPGIFQYNFTVPVLLSIVLVILKKRNNLLLLLPSVFVIGVFCTYFLLVQRYLQRRVDIVVAMSLMVMLCFFFRKQAITAEGENTDVQAEDEIASGKPNLKGKSSSVFALLTAAAIALNIGPISGSISDTFKHRTEAEQNYRDMYERMYEDEEHFYVIVTLCDRSFPVYSIYDDYPLYYFGNNYWTGRCMTRSPIVEAQLEKYDVRNPFKDAVDNPVVCFVSNENFKNKIVRYVNRHYCEGVQIEVVETVEDILIYRLVSPEE